MLTVYTLIDGGWDRVTLPLSYFEWRAWAELQWLFVRSVEHL